ncbi:MAG: EAL domain-containing protein [Alphaproteobacteria bacterium]|nr:EAL domain-containing protein [Alphaproteobacteria bacterium]
MSGIDAALNHVLTDYRFRWTARPASGEIVVVAIDPLSLEAIGVWPLSRRLHAEVIGQLERAGARDIVFDIDFSAPSDPASDAALVKALQDAGGSVVLPSFRQPVRGADRERATHVNRPRAPFADNAWSALVNVPIDSDGRVRRYSFGDVLDGEPTPSMAAVLAGRSAVVSGQFLIDFGISRDSVPVVPFVEVLRGDPRTLASLKQKRVIVGGTALELGDNFVTPNGAVISGPVLQALAGESILQGRDLRLTSGWFTLTIIAALFAAMIALWHVPAPRRAGLLVSIAFAAEAIGLLLQWYTPVVLDTTLLHVAIAFYLGAVALDEIDLRTLLGRIAERRFQRIAMSLGDGLVCVDHRERVTLWNAAAETIFGYRAADIVGEPFPTLLASPGRLALGDFKEHPGSHIVETQGRRQTGETFPLELSLSAWQGVEGVQYGVLARDVSAREAEAARIRYLAAYDTVTGLANRTTFHARIDEMIRGRPGDARFALLIVGINEFQQINDMLGHSAGDLVLKAAGGRIRDVLPDDAVVARLGGEFGVLLPADTMDPQAAAEGLVRAFDTPLAPAREYQVRLSIGTASYPADGGSAEELVSAGHLAQARAKADKHRRVVAFVPAYRQELEARLTLEAELTLAADREEFELFYQPQVRLPDGALVGAEALIRWRHPSRGLVPPGAFIPVVNTSPISERVASWVLIAACKQARAWELAGKPIRVGVNLSPSQVLSGTLATAVRTALGLTHLTPHWLELEVTEDIILADADKALAMFREIQELGVRLVFDDFGTGYASLSYLKKFPLDGLKIDRSFVTELRPDTGDAAIVSSTIELAKKLGLTVIAEGIEDLRTAEWLSVMGCHEGQGYYYGRPVPVAEFEEKFLNAVATAQGDGGTLEAVA